MKYILAVIAILAFLLVLSPLYHLFYTPTSSPTPAALPKSQVPLAASSTEVLGTLKPARTPPEGHREYRNEKQRFAFFYPTSYEVKVFDEGRGAITVTMQSVKDARGFQVFVVPFGGSVVTDERIKIDLPSGVVNEFAEATLDGVPAGTFFSNDQLLGETRELWALRGGYLFEITTARVLDPWFKEAIKSWQFI